MFYPAIERVKKVHQETMRQREAEKDFIYQKRQEIEIVKNDLASGDKQARCLLYKKFGNVFEFATP